ncbi:MAG: helix-turn-helix domain-containing protein [Spirosomataceae bacterium]
MFFRFYPPTPALKPHIQAYMVMHVHTGERSAPIEKPFPAGPDQCLYFYARDEVRSVKNTNGLPVSACPSIIVGPQVTRVNLLLYPDHLTVAVFFRPGGLHRLLGGIPMTELLDFSLDSALIWPSDIRELNEQLANTDNYDLMAALVEGFLVRQYARNNLRIDPMDKALQLMLHPPHVLSIEQLADISCLSTRQFRRKFYEKMGLSPKVFARIVRFNRAFRLKEKNPQLDWLDIICLAGYHDFKHLLRDFKEFSHSTPALLLEAEQKHNIRIYSAAGLTF